MCRAVLGSRKRITKNIALPQPLRDGRQRSRGHGGPRLLLVRIARRTSTGRHFADRISRWTLFSLAWAERGHGRTGTLVGTGVYTAGRWCTQGGVPGMVPIHVQQPGMPGQAYGHPPPVHHGHPPVMGHGQPARKVQESTVIGQEWSMVGRW